MREGIWISSTRTTDLADKAPCLIDWPPLSWYAATDAVRETAHDLYTAATWAEVLGSLLCQKMPPRLAVGMVRNGLKSLHGGELGHLDTITIVVSASSVRKVGMVTIQRGSMQAAVDPQDARTMAGDWLEAACGCEHDSLADEALHTVAKLDRAQRDAVFQYMLAVRTGAGTKRPSELRDVNKT